MLENTCACSTIPMRGGPLIIGSSNFLRSQVETPCGEGLHHTHMSTTTILLLLKGINCFKHSQYREFTQRFYWHPKHKSNWCQRQISLCCLRPTALYYTLTLSLLLVRLSSMIDESGRFIAFSGNYPVRSC